jgi:hypothetical protein
MYCQLIDKKKANNKSDAVAILLTKKQPYFVNKSLKFVPIKTLENP